MSGKHQVQGQAYHLVSAMQMIALIVPPVGWIAKTAKTASALVKVGLAAHPH